MAKLTKQRLSNADKLRAETVIDRSTRIARQILKDEAEQRELKTAHLRKARLEKEADSSVSEVKTTCKRTIDKP